MAAKLTRTKIPAVLYRGGTSKGLLFHKSNLPANKESWKPIFRPWGVFLGGSILRLNFVLGGYGKQ